MSDIRILIVEDEDPKRAHLQGFLESLGIAMCISVARSVNGALDQLDIQIPDLLILDMSLPTWDIGDQEDGGRPQGFGGLEVLRQMSMEGKHCSVIVMTGYEGFTRETGKTVELAQIKTEWTEEFPTMIKGVLHFNSTYDEWKTALRSALDDFGLSRTEALQ